jgi:outer membrane protein TolC
MTRSHQRRWFALLIALSVATLPGCSPNFYKQDADKEVYKIIDSKWQPGFGLKVNYVISDANSIATPNDVTIDKAAIIGVLDKPVTLAQAVALATKYNRDYLSAKEQLYLSALALTGERYKYEIKWFATVDYEYDKKGELPETQQASAQGGVSKTFITPEGIIAHSALTFDWTRFLTNDPRTTISSFLTGDIIVPLLGAGGGKTDWEKLTQSEREVLYQIRDFNRYRQTFVVAIISSYYAVCRNRDSVTNAKNNWNSRILARQQAEMEARIGRTAPYEVAQAQQRELQAYDGYLRAMQSYEQSLDVFKIQLTIPPNIGVEMDQNELTALQDSSITEPDFSSDSAIETALRMRLDLANAADSIDDAVRKVVLAAEGLGTQLDLSASAQVYSTPEKQADRLEFHKGIYSAGISADLPLDRKNQRNAYRTSLINLEQRKRDYQNSIDEIMQDVRQSYRTLLLSAEDYVVQKKSLVLAEERVKNMPLLLKANKAKMIDLQGAQDDLLSAQNSLTSALVGYTMAKLNFYRDVGILQVKPDGMWAQSETVTGKAPNERKPDKQSTDNL